MVGVRHDTCDVSRDPGLAPIACPGVIVEANPKIVSFGVAGDGRWHELTSESSKSRFHPAG